MIDRWVNGPNASCDRQARPSIRTIGCGCLARSPDAASEHRRGRMSCAAAVYAGLLISLSAAAFAAARRVEPGRPAQARQLPDDRPATRHRHARRAGARPGFDAFRATSIRRARKAAASPMACSAPSTASTRSSSRASPPPQIRGYVVESLMARGYDEPFTLYGLLARAVETDADAQLRHLRARSGGAVLRRQAGDRRRRDLLLAAPARQGPAEPPHLLCQGRQGRGVVASARCASISPAPTTASCR